ncbi:MAG: serine/threonine protein kinase, partial [Actinomycetia bacterium]|nr:serine/threonine protein kinase [Actinomycetes bacterium]
GASLGAGGMATVWQATDRLLGRQVAVKVLREQYAADPSFLARFQREARHAASVSDPRIVTVFDCGVDAGAPFIVMELVSGRTLRQVLDQARVLPAGEAVPVAAEMCAALEVAHAAGLVHRDIKPANVLVTSGGQVKILDFGIARMAHSAGLTQTGTLIGTAEYLSPEQAAGQPAGPPADLYAVGCVLYEMLTGTPPFTADSPAVLVYRHVHEQPVPPSARRPGLPPQVDGLVLRLLAKDPAARPGSAAAARAALLAAVSAGPAATVAGQATTLDSPGLTRTLPVTAPPPRRTWPRVLMPVAAAAAGAAAALLAVTLTSHPAPAAADPPATTPTTAARHTPAATPKASPAPAHKPKPPAAAVTSPSTPAVPTMAAAAGNLVRDLEAGVQAGHMTPQAGQNMFGHLQPLLFNPGGQQPQQAAQQDQQQYEQIVQAFDQGTGQGQITGSTTITTLRDDLNELDRTLPSGAA